MPELTVVPQDNTVDRVPLAKLLRREDQLREDLAEAHTSDIGDIIDALETVHNAIKNAVRSFRIEGQDGFRGEIESIVVQCETAGIHPPYVEIANWIVNASRPEDIRDSWRAYMDQ